MEIVAVAGYALSSPIDPPQERPFYHGTRRLRKRDVVLVVVESATGQYGISTAGASSSAMREYFEGDSQATFADIVSGPVADALVGTTVEAIQDAHELLDNAELPTHLRKEAISAIDVALYDLKGKQLGVPVYELLADEYGTDPTTEIPLYASAGMYMEPEGYVQQAQLIEELGFTGYKYRPGIGPEGDRRTVELLTTTIDEMEVMLDVHTWWKIRDGYDSDVVSNLVSYAGAHDVYWVEEPVSPDDREGYVSLATTGAPLAGGESEDSPTGLLELAKTEAVSFLQGDVRHHEGFTGCRAAVEYCRGHDIEFVPHNFGTWIGLMANAQLVAAAPEVQLLEYPVFERDPLLTPRVDGDPGMYPFDLAFDIIEGEPNVEDGVLTLSNRPGLGIEVNLDVISDYPFVEGPWTEFHYDTE